MEPSKQLMNALILGVSHLCERTRELVASHSRDPIAIVPVREAAGMVSTTLEALCSALEEEARDGGDADGGVPDPVPQGGAE